jgi:predicted dehydrogenase
MNNCILIVGFGSIGKRHARIVRELVPNVKIIALRHKINKDSKDINIDHFVTKMDDALKFKPHAAVIANPATYHLEVALPLAQEGIHLLIEKPIANSMNNICKLIDICRQKKLILMVGYNLRFLESLQQFRKFLIEKKIGKVFSVRAEAGQFLPAWRPNIDYRYSVSAKASLGGGVLLELSHEIDYLRWLFGEVEWVSAFQITQSELDVDVEDTVHLVMGFESKTQAKPVVVNLNMDFIRHDKTRICTVIGEKGTLRWDAVSGIISIFEQGASEWENLYTKHNKIDSSYIAEWRHFLECISKESPPVISGDDGLKVLQVVESARRSSRDKNIVYLTDLSEGRTPPKTQE